MASAEEIFQHVELVVELLRKEHIPLSRFSLRVSPEESEALRLRFGKTINYETGKELDPDFRKVFIPQTLTELYGLRIVVLEN